MPRVTICIPAYNAAATIADTLDSLLAQTYGDVEIVVSDNHSTDDMKDVVEGFAGRGVRWVTCPEAPVKTGSLLDNCFSGIQNWNSLPELGTGEFIGIFHADDFYDPDLLERQVQALDRRHGSSAAFTTTRPMGTPRPRTEPAERWFGQLELVKEMLRAGHNVSSSGPLIRRAAWRQAGRFDAQSFEQAVDTDFWIRLAGVGPIAVLSPPMVEYRVHPGQDSSNRWGLYRHQLDPFVKVIEHWISVPTIWPQLDQTDLDYRDARRDAEQFRIAVTHCVDGHEEEARAALDQLPGIKRALELVFVTERPRWPFGVGRTLAVKALSLALALGLGRQAATLIAGARPSLRKWT
jgi:glycosyltransferase involved in cell wall biosynthesis